LAAILSFQALAVELAVADRHGAARVFYTCGIPRSAEHADSFRSYCRAVEPNVLVKAGTILFQIDPAPYEAKVKQLQAAVAEASQKVKQLKAQVELAVADVKGLVSQLDYAEKRRDDIEKLARTSATSQFTLQDAVAKADLLTAQLQAAGAREINAMPSSASSMPNVRTRRSP
jgi:multidrug resistance efflux pump